MKKILFTIGILAAGPLATANVDIEVRYGQSNLENQERFDFDRYASRGVNFSMDAWISNQAHTLANKWSNLKQTKTFDDELSLSVNSAIESYGDRMSSLVPGENLSARFRTELISRMFVYADSEANMRDMVEYANLTFSKTQKLFMLSEAGRMWSTDYAHNTQKLPVMDVFTLNQKLLHEEEEGGVCRHISVGQAKLAEWLGFKNVYVIAFQTYQEGHAITVVQDFEDPRYIYNLNYGEITSSLDQNVGSLINNSSIPPYGPEFRIFNSDGKLLEAVPTPIGLLALEMAGADLTDIDPFYSNETQKLVSITKKTEDTGYGIYKAQLTDSNEDVVGVRAYGGIMTVGDYYSASIKAGATYSTVKREEIGDDHSDYNMFLARLQLDLESKKIQLPADIMLRAKINLNMWMSHVKGNYLISGREGQIKGNDAEVAGYTEVTLEREFGDVSAEVSYRKNYAYDSKHVSDEEHKGLLWTTSLLSTAIKYQLSEEYNLAIKHAVLIRSVGNSSRTSFVALRTKDGQTQYFEVGTTKTPKDLPNFFTASQDDQYIKIGGDYKRLGLKLNFRRLTEMEENEIGLQVNGRFW